MNSCLYTASVMHHRLQPQKHWFSYNVYMFYIDLDELPELCRKYWMISHNRFNFFSFREKEHLQLPADKPDTTRTTREHITAWLHENGMELGEGKIMLLTNLNVLGYNFNPVSFYYCFDSSGMPLCCVAEVSNTFREMKPYLLGPDQLDKGVFTLRTAKYFYVSPFIDHDVDFHFQLRIPGRKLEISIDDYKNGQRFFITQLMGDKVPLGNRVLLWYTIRFPFITGKVMLLILWNALLLWRKKIPWHSKAANQHLQKNVYKKHIPR
ncbi:hypothetical protein SAMN05421788_101875 [Filimonas lacunae]|uniref:DUF1365 domain-containing protein n=1 Tax=Filimonas lacunae TaxID=477680 RepID=A0A173MPQ0_9BACT|nr:DUF1365 domain-containing protein [Filimonas lacunae]BAV09439.1 hypothetical protein FLA_5488 [Filimonas lacunae]SIS73173.1 hypothetical protein SAMN05421788_101875 [Filimonas lacunae]